MKAIRLGLLVSVVLAGCAGTPLGNFLLVPDPIGNAARFQAAQSPSPQVAPSVVTAAAAITTSAIAPSPVTPNLPASATPTPTIVYVIATPTPGASIAPAVSISPNTHSPDPLISPAAPRPTAPDPYRTIPFATSLYSFRVAYNYIDEAVEAPWVSLHLNGMESRLSVMADGGPVNGETLDQYANEQAERDRAGGVTVSAIRKMSIDGDDARIYDRDNFYSAKTFSGEEVWLKHREQWLYVYFEVDDDSPRNEGLKNAFSQTLASWHWK